MMVSFFLRSSSPRVAMSRSSMKICPRESSVKRKRTVPNEDFPVVDENCYKSVSVDAKPFVQLM